MSRSKKRNSHTLTLTPVPGLFVDHERFSPEFESSAACPDLFLIFVEAVQVDAVGRKVITELTGV